ncbi:MULTISPECIES: DUF3231 family protein [Bacillaceae]|uniref:DUF3231 family protein n=1 Tax=Bacillaceae TaxID=186817 RepID=UPI000BA5E311|nr:MULTISPECIES: DUF3231 family protein [Bacillaceae]PAE26068.1 hypothetical protein CHI10_04415 [Bacillus sp. 7894-2]URM34870.1 DUF3231 family protein [Cytobacillus firmus]
MNDSQNTALTAAEIAQLWSAYLNSSLSQCIFTYFSTTVEDQKLQSMLQDGLQLTVTHLKKVTEFLENEGIAIPYGFKPEEDVYPNAPKLFSENFSLHFLYNLTMFAVNFYALAKTLSVRSDIVEYFNNCLMEANAYETKLKNMLMNKGLYMRSPHVIPVKETSFVESKKFMGGLFGDKRPLNVIEITNIYNSLKRNAMGNSIMIGFSQVAKSKEVGQFLIRGRDIAAKHTKIFAEQLEESFLPISLSWDMEVTDSTSPPFSDKLMLFMTTTLIALSTGLYATSAASSARKDISLSFIRLSAEIANYAEDGANILIKNGWFEEPPHPADHDELANR